LLPFTSHEKTSFRARRIFGHSLYRRVLFWATIALIFVGFTFVHRQERFSYSLGSVPFSAPKPASVRVVEHHGAAPGDVVTTSGSETPPEPAAEEAPLVKAPQEGQTLGLGDKAESLPKASVELPSEEPQEHQEGAMWLKFPQ
jgi:hypothetical protein